MTHDIELASFPVENYTVSLVRKTDMDGMDPTEYVVVVAAPTQPEVADKILARTTVSTLGQSLFVATYDKFAMA